MHLGLINVMSRSQAWKYKTLIKKKIQERWQFQQLVWHLRYVNFSSYLSSVQWSQGYWLFIWAKWCHVRTMSDQSTPLGAIIDSPFKKSCFPLSEIIRHQHFFNVCYMKDNNLMRYWEALLSFKASLKRRLQNQMTKFSPSSLIR